MDFYVAIICERCRRFSPDCWRWRLAALTTTDVKAAAKDMDSGGRTPIRGGTLSFNRFFSGALELPGSTGVRGLRTHEEMIARESYFYPALSSDQESPVRGALFHFFEGADERASMGAMLA